MRCKPKKTDARNPACHTALRKRSTRASVQLGIFSAAVASEAMTVRPSSPVRLAPVIDYMAAQPIWRAKRIPRHHEVRFAAFCRKRIVKEIASLPFAKRHSDLMRLHALANAQSYATRLGRYRQTAPVIARARIATVGRYEIRIAHAFARELWSHVRMEIAEISDRTRTTAALAGRSVGQGKVAATENALRSEPPKTAADAAMPVQQVKPAVTAAVSTYR